MVTIVDESLDRRWIWSTPIRVYSLLNSAIEGIISEIHLSGDHIGGIFEGDLGEAISIVPGVFCGFIACDRGASRQIPFIVIGVVMSVMSLTSSLPAALAISCILFFSKFL
jgi:hypothetical protein